MNSAPPNVSVLAGAGLSIDAGLPGSVELADRFRAAVAQDGALTEQVPNSHLCALFRFLDGGIRFQRGILNQDPSRSVNIEEIAVAALRLRQRLANPIAPYVSGWHNRLLELEALHPSMLDVFEDSIYDKIGEWLATPGSSQIAYLSRFADFAQSGYKLNIFTLNYDLLIESALSKFNIAFVNGMDLNRAEWNPVLFRDGSPIRLFKLHGSLDWVDHEMYGICSVQFPRHFEADEFEGAQRPLIIFGTDQKLTAREPFLSLLYHFSTEIRDSDVIVIIGYGFGDTHLNDILVQRLKEKIRLKVVLVHPRPENVLSNIPDLQDSLRVRTVKQGAKVALNDGLVLAAVEEALKEANEESPFK
jgi:hypothetical protein